MIPWCNFQLCCALEFCLIWCLDWQLRVSTFKKQASNRVGTTECKRAFENKMIKIIVWRDDVCAQVKRRTFQIIIATKLWRFLSGLPDWLFRSQKPEIWLFWEAVGSKNFIWLFGYFLALLQHFVPQIFLGEELRVLRAACPRYHKTRSGPPHCCVMLNEHPNIPKKR